MFTQEFAQLKPFTGKLTEKLRHGIAYYFGLYEITSV